MKFAITLLLMLALAAPAQAGIFDSFLSKELWGISWEKGGAAIHVSVKKIGAHISPTALICLIPQIRNSPTYGAVLGCTPDPLAEPASVP